MSPLRVGYLRVQGDSKQSAPGCVASYASPLKSRRYRAFKVGFGLGNPEGPCAQILYTLLCWAYPIWVHGPLGNSVFFVLGGGVQSSRLTPWGPDLGNLNLGSLILIRMLSTCPQKISGFRVHLQVHGTS